MMELDTIICGDCLGLLPEIPDGSIDMVLADPPYGRTVCKWDTVIPFEPMWEQLGRVVKSNGAIVMTANQPFTTALIASNMKMFKYCWVWCKGIAGGFTHAPNMPLKKHEDVVVFSMGSIGHLTQLGAKRMVYNPQGLKLPTRYFSGASSLKRSKHGLYRSSFVNGTKYKASNYPTTLLDFTNASNKDRGLHPTQKPVALMEYLIKTYTNKGETVLDFCMGSGTTAVAALKLGRHFYGCDINPEYVELANKRIEKARLEVAQLSFLSEQKGSVCR